MALSSSGEHLQRTEKSGHLVLGLRVLVILPKVCTFRLLVDMLFLAFKGFRFSYITQVFMSCLVVCG